MLVCSCLCSQGPRGWPTRHTLHWAGPPWKPRWGGGIRGMEYATPQYKQCSPLLPLAMHSRHFLCQGSGYFAIKSHKPAGIPPKPAVSNCPGAPSALFPSCLPAGGAKCVHALALAPASGMAPDALSALPEGSTPCPFDLPENQRGTKRMADEVKA